MSINVVKSLNKAKDNRVEFLFTNFDYYDGIDLIARFFVQDYKMSVEERLDGDGML